MRLLASLFALLMTACTVALPADAAPRTIVVNGVADYVIDLQSKTVALIEFAPGGSAHTYCSAVWVDANYILTANHCVADAGAGESIAYATLPDRLPRGATFVRRDAAHDLALLRATAAPFHASAPLSANPYVGEEVRVMGHSLGFLDWSYSTGVISALRVLGPEYFDAEYDPAMTWLQTTAPVSPGNSGGGIFDSSGNLLGICHGGWRSGQNLNVFVPIRYVRAFLSGK